MNSIQSDSTSQIYYNADTCPFKLPCGYCIKLNQVCPMLNSLSWTETTPYYGLQVTACNATDTITSLN